MDLRALHFAYLLAALAMAGCGGSGRASAGFEVHGSTMGTSYSVKVASPPASLDEQVLQEAAQRELDALEQAMSTYIPDSELSRFNAWGGDGWFPVSAELCGFVQRALDVSELTGGAFDVTVGPLVNLWGFGPDGPVGEPPEAREIAAALRLVGYRKLHTDCASPALRKDVAGLYVDLSAFAKGYAADRVAERLDLLGARDYLVEVGGELRARGRKAGGEDWAIAIETPDPGGRSVFAIVNVGDRGIATSGDYRNFFEFEGRVYSHTIDPTTGYPVSHEAGSVTVLADDAASADALATALLVLGPDAGLQFADAQGIAAYYIVRVGDGLQARASQRFAGEVALR